MKYATYLKIKYATYLKMKYEEKKLSLMRSSGGGRGMVIGFPV